MKYQLKKHLIRCHKSSNGSNIEIKQEYHGSTENLRINQKFKEFVNGTEIKTELPDSEELSATEMEWQEEDIECAENSQIFISDNIETSTDNFNTNPLDPLT